MAPDNFERKKQLKARLERDYVYHSPNPAQIEKYSLLRDAGKNLAGMIVELVPQGREQEEALTSLEISIMQANAGIARHS